MNADAESFDLANQADGNGTGATPPGERAPAAPKPGGKLHHPGERRGAAARPATRKPVRRTAAVQAAPTEAHGLPFLFRPGFLLVLGALGLAVTWAGGLFSGSGASQDWPWTLFQTEQGAFTFTWDAAHVATLLGAFFAVFFLLAPFGPAIRSRGATVLTVAALGLVTFPPLGLADRMVALLGLTAGAVLSREGLRGGTGGRALVFVMVLLLGACLFFPIGLEGEAYDAQALAVGRDLFVEGEFGEVLREPLTAAVLFSVVVFAVALLSWLGIGGRWSVWVAGVALILGVFGPMVLAYAPWTGYDSCQAGLKAVAGGLPADFLVFTLPVAAGTLDASRP